MIPPDDKPGEMDCLARLRDKPVGEHQMINMGAPLVSVILPTYNRSHSIMRAVSSVLHQTFRDFDLIVVDDGSNDDTAVLLDMLHDERLRYIRCSENRGVAAARNIGIQASHGSLIAFQDSDDIWFPEKLALQIELLQSCGPDVGVVYAPLLRAIDGIFVEFPGPADRLQGKLHERLLYGNMVSTQVALVRRESLEKMGLFDERLPCLVDWELWLRISKVYEFSCVNRVLAQVHVGPNSISRDSRRLAQALELILEKHHTSFQAHEMALAQHTYTIGHLLCLNGELERGRDYLRTAIRLQPDRLRYRVVAALTLLGAKVYQQLYSLKIRLGGFDYL